MKKVKDASSKKVPSQGSGTSFQSVDKKNSAPAQSTPTALDETFCRHMMEVFPLPVFVHQSGVFLYANQKAAELHGAKSPSEIIGRPLTDFLMPGDLAKFNKLMSQNEANAQARYQLEIRILRLDGNFADLEVFSTPLRLEGKNARLAVCIDRTEHKRQEMDREYGFQFLQTLLDTIPNPIFYKDRQGAYLGCNRKFSKKILGLSPDEIIGKTVFDFRGKIPKNLAEVYADQDRKLLEKPGVQSYEAKVKCCDGIMRDFIFYKATFYGTDGEVAGIVGVMMDITELREAGRELFLYQEKLREMSSSMTLEEELDRRRIAEDLNEQIGQTLAVSKMKLGALKAVAPSSELMAPLDEIRDLIGQTIQATRALTFQLSPPVLHEVGLRAALDWLVENFNEQGRIEFKFESQSDEVLALDNKIRVLLFKATRELLFNIAAHSGARTATVTLLTENDHIRIQVSDDGVGMDLKKITGSGDEQTGFGLFGIQERMNLLGGSLALDSLPGKGTTIILTSPIKLKN